MSSSGPQFLICMKGHPGTGKSSLAMQLAKYLKVPLVDKDDVRDVFEPVIQAQQTQTPPSHTSPDWNTLSYDVMFNVALRQLLLGLSVVVDCPLSNRQLYIRACDIAHKVGAHVVVVECVCGREDVWKERLERRGADIHGTDQAHKPTTWAQLQQLLERYQGSWRWPVEENLHEPHRVIVDTCELDESAGLGMVLRALQQLQGRGATGLADH